ncbi:MAG: hypothetical protein LBV11_00985 [Bacillus cereus]|jgi:hypothetical protein|nr:hypothetical protein [Bacillus cereus]
MKVIKKYTDVFSLFKVDHSIIIIMKEDDGDYCQKSYNLNNNKLLKTSYLRDYGSYLYDFAQDKLKIYDSEFNHLYDIQKEDAKYSNTSIGYMDANIVVISQSIWNNQDKLVSYYTVYENQKPIASEEYCGKFLNMDYRLNFKYEEKYNPTYFRLSDLLDKHTYFEYECEKGEESDGRFILYKDKLIFYTREKEKESYDTLFWVNVLDINTGNQLYKMEVEHYCANFDYQKGKFVSIEGICQNNSTIKRYEIVDINSGVVERENFHYEGFMFAVGTTVQYLDQNKLYFADNIKFEGQSKTPKIGCFNIDRKEILFMEDLKEAEVHRIDQIISNKGRIYARTNTNDLFIMVI